MAPSLPRSGKIDQNQFQPNLPASDSLILVSLAGVVVGQERQINFVAGAGVTLTITDDPANGQVTITISAP